MTEVLKVIMAYAIVLVEAVCFWLDVSHQYRDAMRRARLSTELGWEREQNRKLWR